MSNINGSFFNPSYENCQYVATAAILSSDLSSSTCNGKIDLAGNTPAANERALLRVAGTSALLGCFIYSGTEWALDPQFVVTEGASVHVMRGSNGPSDWTQTAETGAATAVFALTSAPPVVAPNIAAMALLAGMTVGAVIRVQTLGCLWTAVPSGTSTPDGITYVAGVGVDWQRIVGSSDAKWLTQGTWYLDASSGNDENLGDSTHPLLTATEIQRRWGPEPIIGIDITITIAPGTYARVDLRAIPANPGLKFTVIGIATATVTTTLGVYTKYTHGTYGSVNPEATIVSAPAVSDWTPYLGMRLRSGASGTLLSWIAKVNPAGGGITTARVSPFGSQALTGSRLWTQSDPVVTTQPLYIETLPIVNDLWIDWKGAGSTTAVVLEVENLAITDVCHLSNAEGTRTRLYGCDIQSAAQEDVGISEEVGNVRIHGCRLANPSFQQPQIYYGCFFFTTGLGIGGASTTSLIVSCLIQGGGHGISCNGFGGASLTDVQVFDSTANLVHISNAGFNLLLTNVSGMSAAANTAGLYLRDSCNVLLSGTINLIITGGVDIALGSLGATYGASAIHWSDVPAEGITPGVWSGTATLTSGVFTVTLSPALTALFLSGSDIQAGYILPKAGAAPLGYDTVTTGGFRLNNGSGTDNTSTVWWKAQSKIRRTDKIISQSYQ